MNELTIRISPGSAGDYVVSFNSPLGNLDSALLRDELPDDVDSALQSLGRSISASPPADVTSLRKLGRQMYDSLFHGAGRELLNDNLHATAEGNILRVNLGLDTSAASLGALHRLPWEALYRVEDQAFLAMNEKISITRVLKNEGAHERARVRLPLRVLVALSSPNDRPWLDLHEERRQIEASWATCPGVQVDYLENASIPRLSASLAGGNYHVLHFMGHAEFDAHSGRGALVFEDDDTGASVLLSSIEFGRLIRSEPSLQLAYLNACSTGVLGSSSEDQAFSGLAATLTRAGVPAVVAMQLKVTDEFAIYFAKEFYDRLTQELPVDRAVSDIRRTLSEDLESTLEWMTPVLYNSVPDGVLFDFEAVYGFGQG